MAFIQTDANPGLFQLPSCPVRHWPSKPSMGS